ncbi:MAG: hypothetical protein DMG40_15440 [Acidobacteria bacterium]|nr:MAG: hypothetical protein DMG40_15440 [Acidobacteriota bacterium]
MAYPLDAHDRNERVERIACAWSGGLVRFILHEKAEGVQDGRVERNQRAESGRRTTGFCGESNPGRTA